MAGGTVGWSRASLGGKEIEIFQPDTTRAFDAALLYLHSLQQEWLSHDPDLTGEFARQCLPVVCPRGQQACWLDRICPDFDNELTPLGYLQDHVVPWIEQQWGVAPPRIGLLGVEMGGQGVLQLAYRAPRQFPVVAAISPAVDFQNLIGQALPLDDLFADREAARQQTATLQIHPLNWPPSQWLACDPADPLWFEGAERLGSKLSSMGIPYEVDLETTTEGDARQYVRLMGPRAVAYLAERLRSLPGPG